MSLADLHREGYRVTWADKLETVACLGELEGFERQTAAKGYLTEIEAQAIEARRVQLNGDRR